MDRDEERRIIAQVCAGDTNAFEALVVAYQNQVYNSPCAPSATRRTPLT